MDKSLFEQARPILEQIQDNGFEAYYVGGSVRDYVMGRNITTMILISQQVLRRMKSMLLLVIRYL